MQNYPVVSSGQPNKVSSNPAYQSLYDVNPYSGAGYYESPWQQFLSSMGFRTGANAWQENMAVQSAEYNAQIAQKQYDEEYNLPINQVARMRAAGLNPDLSGGDGISSGEAQNLGQDPSTPMMSQGDEGKLMEFANGILSCVSMAAGIAGTLENVKGLRLDNFLKELSTEDKITSYSKQIFPYLIPTNPNDVFDSEGNFSSNASERFNTAAQIFLGDLPPRLRSKVSKNISAFWNSAPGTKEKYQSWLSELGAIKDYEIGSRSNFSWDSDEMRIIADELGKLASKVEKNKLRSTAAESGYNAEYYDKLDADVAAGAENAENKMNKENFEMVGTLRKSLNSIIQRLNARSEKFEKEGRKGVNTSSVLLAALSMFQLYLASSGSPSVKRSSSSSVDAKGNTSYQRNSVIEF